MARTAHRRGNRRRREQPLGTAIGLGVLTTFGVGLLILIVQMIVPNSTLHNFYLLAQHNASATLPLDPLYQQWSEKIQEEEALFATPLSLLCGGLVLGGLAPRYLPRRTILSAGALLALGVVAASLLFVWSIGVTQQDTLNRNEGGQIVHLTAPLELIVRQALWSLAWTLICVLGTWLGLRGRDRRRPAATPASAAPASPSAARRQPLT